MRAVDSREFHHGVGLLKQGKFFEAHEVLEDLWRPMPLSDPNRIVMQGLVQIAVALHHHSTGNRTGALSVMRRASRNLSSAGALALGVHMNLLRPSLDEWIHTLEAGDQPATSPRIELVEQART